MINGARTNRLLIFLLPLSMGGLSGCASLGDSSYSCEGLPEGVQCETTRDVYKQSVQGGDSSSQQEQEQEQKSESSDQERRDSRVRSGGGRSQGQYAHRNAQEASVPERPPVTRTQQLASGFGPGPQPQQPRPARTPAQVMRIWHAPFEDQDGDLHMSGYSFTEVEDRRWQYGVRSPDKADARMLRLNPEEAPAPQQGGMGNPMPNGGPSGEEGASPSNGGPSGEEGASPSNSGPSGEEGSSPSEGEAPEGSSTPRPDLGNQEQIMPQQ